MQISVIVGHPYQDSFNAALAQTVTEQARLNGHVVNYHDLQAENFDPVMSANELTTATSNDSLLKLHQQEIQEADGIIVIHPNWWGQPPAILKG